MVSPQMLWLTGPKAESELAPELDNVQVPHKGVVLKAWRGQ